MAIRTYKVTLDSKNTLAPEPVYLRQGDKTGAVVIDATLMDNGAPVSIDGLTPMFKANTADGQAVIADSTGFNIVNASGGEFTYQVPNALSAVPGKIVTAYFSFSDASGSESTFDVAFIIKKAVDITKSQADEYITIIDGTLQSLQQKIDAMNTDVQTILDAFNQGNFYNKAQTDDKDSATLASAKSYADTQDKTKADKTALAQTNANMMTNLSNKVDKGGNEQVTLGMLSQEVKTSMTGGSVAVVGKNAVNTTNLVDKASTYAKRTVLGNIASVNCLKKPANYDTVAGTLTIYNGTTVTHGKGSFTSSADVVLDVIGTGSQLKKIMFDTATNTFFALPYNDYTSVNDENCLFLGTVNSYPDNQTINLVFDCTIDGIYHTVSKEKSIPTKSLNINARVSRIILNSNGQFPNIDTTIGTLTFYNDTILVLSTGEYYILPDTVVDLTANASSALKIYFDTFNKVFTVRAYADQVNEDDWIFVCAVRKSSGALSIPCAYNVNGKPFGLTIPNSVVKNPLNAHVKAILHRGYTTVAPENTIPAYELAKKMGFSYVETDVKWTSDGVPVLLHDNTVDRTSDGTGAIADLTFSYARSLDFGSGKGSEYAGTLIPTFEEFILSCKKLNLHPYIHINELVTVEKAQELVGIVRKQGMIKNVSWISFTTAALTNICTAYPKSRIGRLSGTFDETILDDARALKTTENDVFLDVDAPALTKEMIEVALSEDIYVETYTVDYSNLVEGYVNMGVSGITTDNLNIAEILGNTY